MAQSQWAENVGGIFGGLFGSNGAADEIAAIGGLKNGGTTSVNTGSVSTTTGTGGNGIIYIGLVIVAIFVLIMLFKK